MWRHKSFTGNQDSDQSISDEEDDERDNAWNEDCVSLAGTLDRKKEALGVASQLDLLKGIHQKGGGFSSEDEVEIPHFQDKSTLDFLNNVDRNSISLKRDGFTCELDEQISDDEKGSKMLFNSVAGPAVSETLDLYSRGKGKRLQPQTHLTVAKGARRVVNLGEESRCSEHHTSSSKDKYHTVGSGQTTKFRLSSHFQPHKKDALWRSSQKGEDLGSTTDDELLDEPEPLDYQPKDKSTAELLGGSHDQKTAVARLDLPLEAVIQHDHFRHTVAELLDGLCGKNRNLNLKSKRAGKRGGRKGKQAVTRKGIMSYEEPCEILHSASSTDDEKQAQNHELAIVAPERKTMADKFQEAFGSASVDDRRPASMMPRQSSSSGLFGRLQQIMQKQKEQDSEFLKKLQAEVWPKDESRCVDVKILSRTFDAKLTVCQCSLLENEESSVANPHHESFGKMWTVIFNSRICCDVDVEVANLIRIHPPWKEVQVQQSGEIIILAAYFSQIYT